MKNVTGSKRSRKCEASGSTSGREPRKNSERMMLRGMVVSGLSVSGKRSTRMMNKSIK